MDAKYTTNQEARHDLFRIGVAHREPNMSLNLTDSKLIKLAQREGFFKSDNLMLMGQPLFARPETSIIFRLPLVPLFRRACQPP